MNITGIPAELRDRPQWVVWKLEHRDGKATKVPYRADGAGRASTTDAASWGTFEAALAASEAPAVHGIGYVFSTDDPFVGVDLDAGLGEGDRGAIMLALDSYTEASVSGRGYHVIVRASLNGYGRNRRGPFEVYEAGRYFVVTGDHVFGTPETIEDRQAELELVLAEFLPPAVPATPPRPPRPVELDDRELLERMLASRPHLQPLWNGDTSGHGGDHSAADLALARELAYWTGRDPARVDAIFRASGLMRAKWDERRGDTTYGARTIAKAIAGDARHLPTEMREKRGKGRSDDSRRNPPGDERNERSPEIALRSFLSSAK